MKERGKTHDGKTPNTKYPPNLMTDTRRKQEVPLHA